MRFITTKIATFLLFAIVLSPITFAQTSTPSDWSAVKAVTAGAKLKVKLKSGKTHEGEFSSATDDAVVIKSKGAQTELKRDDVLTVHQSTKKSATAATLIGMGIGAGAGAAVGAAGSNDDTFDKVNHAATAGLAVVGAGVGALTGYLIGRSGRKQILIYQAK
jgi:hypothetical protein